MLAPRICGCGCLQPVLPGNRMTGDMLFNHTRRASNTPSYLVRNMGYATPCWLWQGSLNKWGYAKLKRDGRTQGGHRLFYRAYVDANLPVSTAGGNGLDHLCRVRCCVNPEHLEPVTCTENIHRGKAVKVVPGRLREIRARYLNGESQRKIAIAYGVRQSCISRILRGARWRSLVEPTPTRSSIKLTSEQVESIRSLSKSGVAQCLLAEQFGMGQSQISRIVRRQSWTTTILNR